MRLVGTLVALWALAFAASFLHFYLTEPMNSGFTRGMNKLVPWAVWQAVALALAVAAFAYSLDRPRTRRIGAVPLVATLVLLVAAPAWVIGGLLVGGK